MSSSSLFTRPPFSRVFPANPRPRTLIFLFTVTLIKAAALVIFAHALTRVLLASAQGQVESLWLLVGAAAAAVRGGAEWAARSGALRAALEKKHALRSQLLRRWMYHSGAERSAPILVNKGLDGIDSSYTQFLPALIEAACIPLIVGVNILLIDWVSALIILLTLPLIPVFMALIGWYTEDRVREALATVLRLSSHIAELARGLPVLVGLGRAHEQRHALDEMGRRYSQRVLGTLKTAFLSALALELLATLSVAVVAVSIGLRLLYGNMDLSAGLLVLILAPECYLPLRQVGAAFHASDDGREAMRRVEDELAKPPPQGVRVHPARPGAAAAGLTLQQVSVRYPGRERALHPVDLTLRPGQLCALRGPSGSGKSTLLAALAGILPPQALVEGQAYGLDRAAVAWMPQDPTTTEETAGAELRLWGSREPTKLLARMGLEGHEHSHPGTLSTGQLRRLAFARVLARVEAGATVLLLDEPTAHLDAACAHLVLEQVRALRHRGLEGLCLVIATHDPRVFHLADVHLELEQPMAARREEVVVSAEPMVPTDETAARGTPNVTIPEIADFPQGRPGRERNHLWGLLSWWVELLRPRSMTALTSLVCAVLASGAAVSLAGLSGWLIVRASEQPPTLYLLTAIVGVRFFGLLRALARYAERLATHATAMVAADRLRGRLWTALSRTLVGTPGLHRGDAILDILVDRVDRLRDLAPRVLAPPAASTVTALLLVIASVIMWPASPLVFLAVSLVSVCVVPLLAWRVTRRAQLQESRYRSRVTQQIATACQAASQLRVNGVAERLVGRAIALDRAAVTGARRLARREGAAQGLLVSSLSGAALVLAVLGGLMGGELESSTAAVLLILALIDVSTPVLGAASSAPVFAHLSSQLKGHLDVPQVPELPTPEPEMAIQADQLVVGWNGRAVTDPLNFQLAAGEWLTVLGPSGAGKSTLLGSMMGLTAPISGLLAAPTQVAWCPQEAHIFDSSLRGNLALATSPAPSEETMLRALEQVGLGPWLARLTDGLDTRVGSHGGQISGGQRQRLAVARALLTPAELVLLDEPTAHIEPVAARALMRDLRAALKGRTVVLVTHRQEDRHGEDVMLSLRGCNGG